jgi:periplasmic divalent cation tolerance protein
MPHALTLLYIPTPTLEAAKTLGHGLLDAKLVACANIVAATSLYDWQGAREESAEWLVMAKTLPELADAAEHWVLANHPYDTPAILRLSATVNAAYYAWAKSAVTSAK